MDVVIYRPMQTPCAVSMENTLKAMQEKVGGLIEVVRLFESVVAVFDEEAELKTDIEPCILLGNTVIYGPVFFCRTNKDGEFESLHPKDIKVLEPHIWRIVR